MLVLCTPVPGTCAQICAGTVPRWIDRNLPDLEQFFQACGYPPSVLTHNLVPGPGGVASDWERTWSLMGYDTWTLYHWTTGQATQVALTNVTNATPPAWSDTTWSAIIYLTDVGTSCPCGFITEIPWAGGPGVTLSLDGTDQHHITGWFWQDCLQWWYGRDKTYIAGWANGTINLPRDPNVQPFPVAILGYGESQMGTRRSRRRLRYRYR